MCMRCPDISAETVLAVHLYLASELAKLPWRLRLCCTIWCLGYVGGSAGEIDLAAWHAYSKESTTCIHTAIQRRLLLCILRTSSPTSSPFHSILPCWVYHRKHLLWRCGWLPPYRDCWKRRDYYQDSWRSQRCWWPFRRPLFQECLLNHFAGWNITSVFIMLESKALSGRRQRICKPLKVILQVGNISTVISIQVTNDLVTFIFAFWRWVLKILPSVLYVCDLDAWIWVLKGRKKHHA